MDEDSSSWGNYQDSISPANVSGYGTPQDTGYSEYWSANKIYDLAGNYYDWIQEAYYTNNRIYRGGYYSNSGSVVPGVNGIILCRKMAKKNVVFPTYFLYLKSMI